MALVAAKKNDGLIWLKKILFYFLLSIGIHDTNKRYREKKCDSININVGYKIILEFK